MNRDFEFRLTDIASGFGVGKKDAYAMLMSQAVEGVDYVLVAPGHAGVYVTRDCVRRMARRNLDALASLITPTER